MFSLSTAKLRAFWSAVITGVAELLSHLASMPAEAQTGLLGQISDIFPVAWRGQISVLFTVISRVAGLYAIYSASHSGPQSPPKNPVNE